MSVISIIMITIVVVSLIYIGIDEYRYWHGKPEKTVAELSVLIAAKEKEIQENVSNKSYALQYAYRELDILVKELRRAESWNRKHPKDAL